MEELYKEILESFDWITSCLIEFDDSKIYCKIWFSYKQNKTMFSSGRQEFVDIVDKKSLYDELVNFKNTFPYGII